jgi:hypothetical protein
MRDHILPGDLLELRFRDDALQRPIERLLFPKVWSQSPRNRLISSSCDKPIVKLRPIG